MAMFTLIEINGDHLGDLESGNPDSKMLGEVLAAVVRNPFNAFLLEAHGFGRVIRVVKQTGEQHK